MNKTICCAEKSHAVHKADLPISCPPPELSGWDGHPRVFLELKEGKALCPYCGTQYVLVDDDD